MTMSIATCHDPSCVNYTYPRQMRLGSVVEHSDGSVEHIWESGVYCVCLRRLHDIKHPTIAVAP